MKHAERMARIAMTLMPPKGSPAYAAFADYFDKVKDDPRHKRALKRSWAAANATVLAQLTNGAGREGDQVLRYFLSDICNRVWSLGPWDSLPSSFNVTSDFTRYIPKINAYELLDEVDHEFTLADFLDFVTDPRRAAEPSAVYRLIPSGKIYHFTNVAPLDETTAGDSGTQRFVIASLALVRHETELSVCMVAGQPVEAASGLAIFGDPEKLLIPEGKERLKEIAIKEQREPVLLRGEARWWKIVLLMRMNLPTRTSEVRYVLRDCGDVFDLITDDPSILLDSKGQPISEDWEEILRKGGEKLREFGPLFELAQYAALLPSYFNERNTQVRPRTVRTEFGQKQSSTKFRRQVAASRPNARISYRTLFEMHPSSVINPNFMIAPAALRIERSGYWKALRADQTGVDRSGNSIQGRTWVGKELTWIENAAPTQDLRIEMGEQPHGRDPGYIYVLRNASHPGDVFKIGLTRRSVEQRADELSASTGVPDRFLIVQRWNVTDCERAETLIHEHLAAYRLVGRREFFKVPYERLREAVEHVLSQFRDPMSS